MTIGRIVKLVWIFLIALSWLGVVYILYSTRPEGVNLWLFFLALFASFLTTSTPFAYYLHFRFAASKPERSRMLRALREGALVGFLIVLCAWLQMIRALNWMNGMIIFGILALLETFLLAKG